jgi:uncharacterized protein (DUF2267 family)
VRRGEREIVLDVLGHAGPIGVDAARRLLGAVLSTIGAHLSAPERERVAAELPAPLAACVVHADGGTALPIDERILAPGMTAARAHELIAAACRALADTLSAEVRAELTRALPVDLAALLAPGAPGTPPHLVAPGRRATLATGRPGSARPVSATRAERTQAGSIAADNPHGDRKLSSAPGTTQVRDHDTLAEAGPGRPLSRTRG